MTGDWYGKAIPLACARKSVSISGAKTERRDCLMKVGWWSNRRNDFVERESDTLGGDWIAPEVIFIVDGEIMTTEKYSEIRGDVTLAPKLFDPLFWTTAH
jgi:hypothetical protein